MPLLLREDKIVELSVVSEDLLRDLRKRCTRQVKLEDAWRSYMDEEMTTTQFLRRCASLYGVREDTAPEWKEGHNFKK